MTLRAIAFDAYGTLFDVYSVGTLAEQLFPGKGAELTALWRSTQIGYTHLRTLADRYDGKRYDCGSKEGFLQANVELALAHPQLGPGFRDYLKQFSAIAPLHENVTIEQVGSAAAFLAGDGAAAITGDVLYVDNGFNIMGLANEERE